MPPPVLRRLAEAADVIVESGRPGVMERWGVDGDALARAGKIVVHLSAFGRDGPLANLPGHGLNLDGVAGLGFSTPDGAVAPGWMPVSVLAGPVFAAQAACAALYRRERTGRGAELDVSCSEAGLFWQQFLGAPDWNPDVTDNEPMHGPARAKYSVYETKDHRRMIFCAIEPRFFAAFCREAGRPDLAEADAPNAGVEFDFASRRPRAARRARSPVRDPHARRVGRGLSRGRRRGRSGVRARRSYRTSPSTLPVMPSAR